MALLNTYTNDNKEIETGLTITYAKTKVFGVWVAEPIIATGASVTYTEAWEYRRFAVGTFKYIGLDYSTAIACANAMNAKYTRTTQVSVWDPVGQSMYDAEFVDKDGGSMPMADVSVQKTAGHMYEVIVSVRETDTRMRMDGTEEPEDLFEDENERNYSEFNLS